jgi:hypothetical protein
VQLFYRFNIELQKRQRAEGKRQKGRKVKRTLVVGVIAHAKKKKVGKKRQLLPLESNIKDSIPRF